MTHITLIVTGAHIRAEVHGALTSGMVGIPVSIRYDEAWDGLTKNLVCRCSRLGPVGGDIRTILNVGETAKVAHEIMQAENTLYLGVEGYNADGSLVMPTAWANCGYILPGANAGADISAVPALPVWAQLQTMIGTLANLNTETRENLVEAINEVLGKAGNGNADLTGYVNSVNGKFPDENGNVEVEVSGGNSGGLTGTEKNLILALFKNAAYTSAGMGDTLTQLKNLWNGNDNSVDPDNPDVPVDPDEPEKILTGISAVYSGGSVTAGTAVNTLTGIVVTAHYSDGTSEAVTGYTLSGTIAEGSNTITVIYGGKTTTITVMGVAESSGLPQYEYAVVGNGLITNEGVFNGHAQYDCTDFIDIDPNYSALSVATYMDAVSDARISSSSYVQWNNGDTFISRTGGSLVIEIGNIKCTKPIVHTAPEGATKFRVCVQNNCDNFVLYKGTVSASDI